MKILFPFILCAVFSDAVNAQTDSITVLEPVVLKISVLKGFSNTQHVRVLSDSLVENSSPLLTDILKFHTPIYFKENGYGMVSSVSFRGTTASQTAVVWNGININSKFNGQTDFNAINISGFDEISVRSGGGSVLFGSGAIGGSVHLNNTLQFENGFENQLKLAYGSFEMLDARYKISASNKKTSVQASLSRNSSRNDFSYPNSDRKNLNGQYENTSVDAGFTYKFDRNNTLKIHTSVFDGERHFSLIRATETPTKYRDFHAWNLVAWEGIFNRISSELKVAYLNEEFDYFPNIEEKFHTGAKAETFLGSYALGLDLKHGIKLHGSLDYSHTKGSGAEIARNFQKIASAAFLVKHKVSERFLYEMGAKKEFTENYKSPFLYSAGTRFEVTDFYALKLNISKNYRIPTFNDMFWDKSGNVNLKPETSHQMEIGNYFHGKNASFSLTGFFISIRDMIQWVPSATIWKPTNVDEVESYGLESNFNFRKNFGKHRFSFHANYAYTVSKDKKTGNQLIYVPLHKATAALNYHFKRWNLTYDFLLNGKVFVSSDNNDEIPGYSISNFVAAYSFLLKSKNQIKLGAKLRNIFDEAYQSMENRFMPGRNFNVFLTFKF